MGTGLLCFSEQGARPVVARGPWATRFPHRSGPASEASFPIGPLRMGSPLGIP